MRHPDTCTHRYRYVGNHISGHLDAWTPRHLDTQTSRRPDKRTPKSPDIWTPRHQETQPTGHPDIWAQKKDIHTFRHLDTKTSGYQDTWITGHKDIWKQEPSNKNLDSWTPRHKDETTLRHPKSKHQCTKTRRQLVRRKTTHFEKSCPATV